MGKNERKTEKNAKRKASEANERKRKKKGKLKEN